MRTANAYKTSHVGTAAPGCPAEQSSAASVHTYLAVVAALLFAFLSIAVPPPTSAQTTSWKQIPIPQLPDFKPKQPKRVQLSNGMVIFLQEDHELPLIGGYARIRGGSVERTSRKSRPGRHLRRCLANGRNQDSDRRST